MYTRVRLYVGGLAVVAALAVGSVASAASLNISSYAPKNVAGALADLDSRKTAGEISITENFEGFASWNGTSGTANPSTAVGVFTAIGGTGYGTSVIGNADNLQVRNDNDMAWRRHNMTTGGNSWLDSNDTYGMKWEVGGLPAFNALSFILTDVADQGAKFSIKIGDTVFSSVLGGAGRLADGGIYVVDILLTEVVTSLTVLLQNDRLNDGFGIDNVRVALTDPSLAPVPVPPAALLLLTGTAVIAAVRRRRNRAAA